MQRIHGRLLVSITAFLMLAVTQVGTATGLNDPGSGTRPPSTDGAPTNLVPVCPDRDRRRLTSTATGASAMLVPPGAREVLLCRYSAAGLAPKSVPLARLIAHRLVTRLATVESLASALNALRTQQGPYACPADNGKAIIAFFRYSLRSDDPVTIGLSGCSIVTNGHLNRLAGVTASGRGLLSQLDALLSCRLADTR